LKTLAATVGEEAETLEDVVEPFLLQRGFLQRTRGQDAYLSGLQTYGINPPPASRAFCGKQLNMA
jgi:Holliday junction DNA helicase RuvB